MEYQMIAPIGRVQASNGVVLKSSSRWGERAAGFMPAGMNPAARPGEGSREEADGRARPLGSETVCGGDAGTAGVPDGGGRGLRPARRDEQPAAPPRRPR